MRCFPLSYTLNATSGGVLSLLLFYIGRDVSFSESPETTLFFGLDFSSTGQFDHIIWAAIKDLGDIFAPENVLAFCHWMFLASRRYGSEEDTRSPAAHKVYASAEKHRKSHLQGASCKCTLKQVEDLESGLVRGNGIVRHQTLFGWPFEEPL